MTRRLLGRLDAGTTLVRYLRGLDPRPTHAAVISSAPIATQGTRSQPATSSDS